MVHRQVLPEGRVIVDLIHRHYPRSGRRGEQSGLPFGLSNSIRTESDNLGIRRSECHKKGFGANQPITDPFVLFSKRLNRFSVGNDGTDEIASAGLDAGDLVDGRGRNVDSDPLFFAIVSGISPRGISQSPKRSDASHFVRMRPAPPRANAADKHVDRRFHIEMGRWSRHSIFRPLNRFPLSPFA